LNKKTIPFAIIDIGTNTIILLIAKKKGVRGFEVLVDKAVVTRLGQGLSEHHFFHSEAMKRSRAVLKDFAAECKKWGVKKIVAIGTAACRLAANAEVFIQSVKKECGISIEVISGNLEAEYAFLATHSEFGKKFKKLIVVDIGGGSTEIITGPAIKGKGPTGLISLGMGSVRLTEQFVRTDPILSEEFHRLKRSIKNTLNDELEDFFPEEFNPQDHALVATAGTATTLVAINLKLKKYNPLKVHGYKLKKNQLDQLMAQLAIRSVRERQQLPGLDPLRADVILAGAMILGEVMEYFDKSQVIISDRGLRYGVLYKKFLK
jgi:exopolyphosphatase/guanosine-5'-triphosphate,3'-diphosphate pyrophosphatase